jgi:carboxyl-terminal processing protease
MKITYNTIVKMVLVLCLILTPLSAVSAADNLSQKEELQLFEEIYDKLLDYHVDQPSEEQLIDGAIEGMIAALDDPYTTYLTAGEYKEFLDAVNGSFIGIGVYVEKAEDGLLIKAIISGGSAEKAGLQHGDVITQVDGNPLEDSSLEEAISLILGEEGTDVEISIIRTSGEQKETITYTLKREKITLPLTEVELLENNVGYLKLYRFGENAASAVKKGLQDLEDQGMESLIFDLRGNPGGFSFAAMEIGKQFIESGVVFHAKNHTGESTAYSISNGKNFTKPMVILVNEGSASASELLAGFLQDSSDAKVLGNQTFGKGTVQRLIELDHGGALKVTIEEYFTPNKNQVNGKGITPDIFVEDPGLQLPKAYGYLAGKDEVWINQAGDIQFNGLAESVHPLKAMEVNGEWYVPLRAFSEWYNGEVNWDSQTKSILVTFSDREFTIERDSSAILMKAGNTYILLEEMSKLLPLQVEQKDGTMIITESNS